MANVETAQSLWTKSLRSLLTLSADFLHSEHDLFCSRATFTTDPKSGEQMVVFKFWDAKTSQDFATIALKKNPQETSVTFKDGSTKRLDELGLSWIKALAESIYFLAQELSILALTDPIFQTRREIYCRNSEYLVENYTGELIAEQSKDETQAKFKSELTLRTHAESRVFGPQQFSFYTNIPWNGKGIRIYCNEPLSPEYVSGVAAYLMAMPPTITDFFSRIRYSTLNETVSITLVTPEEFAKLAPKEGQFTTAAKYLESIKCLVIPLDYIKDPKNSHTTMVVAHEFCHAIFDLMTPDAHLPQALTSAYEKGSRAFLEYAPDALKDRHPSDVAIPAAGTVGVGSYGLLKVLGGGPYLAVALLGVGLGVSGYAIADQKAHFAADQEGLLKKEYDKMNQKIQRDPSLRTKISVSPYATDDSQEFAEKTLLAYSQTEDDLRKYGIFSGDRLHGPKTREELKAKHPMLYLAYERVIGVFTETGAI